MAELKEAIKAAPEARKGNGPVAEKRPVPMLEPWNGIDLFEPMGRFAEEMDRLFEGFGMPVFETRRPGLLRRWLGRMPRVREEVAWAPRIEVTEREGRLMIRAELPGMTKDQVKVEVTDAAVTIRGERKAEKEEERKGYHYSECSYGSFYRCIPLPEGVDPARAVAEFHDGVLEVSMPGPPPAPETRSRTLEIKGS